MSQSRLLRLHKHQISYHTTSNGKTLLNPHAILGLKLHFFVKQVLMESKILGKDNFKAAGVRF